jgi:hypothetical protein
VVSTCLASTRRPGVQTVVLLRDRERETERQRERERSRSSNLYGVIKDLQQQKIPGIENISNNRIFT